MRWGFAASVILFLSSAGGQQTDQSQESAQPLNNGNDFTRPLNRFDLRYNFRDKGDGIGQNQFILRLEKPFQIADNWKIATRFDMPFVLSNNTSSDNPNGKYGFGTGDFFAQGALINNFTERFAYGAGVRVLFPTANADQFGAGKYQLIPFVGFRYFIPEISKGTYFEPVIRYDADLGGYGGRKHISQLQMGPMFNLDFPGRWFLTLFPSQDIVLNTIGGHKWFVPADFMIGQNVTKTTVVAVEISIPVIRQFTLYDFKLEARISHSF
ncbi:MAG TPA: hypothetical protein VGM54_10420 [Chthoniobacter sp.]